VVKIPLLIALIIFKLGEIVVCIFAVILEMPIKLEISICIRSGFIKM